jgi:hypothetical protein
MKIPFTRNVGLLTLLCTFGLIAAAPATSSAQLFRRWCEPCVPCPTAPSGGTAGTAGPGVSGSGAAAAGEAPAAGQAAPNNLFAQSDVGATSGPESVAPTMVGDYLGGFFTMAANGGATQTIALPGGAVPRFKMAENTSPVPIDRVFFNYDYYSDVPLNTKSMSLNGFTPGFEKTFLGGAMSVEVRLPMATTLDNNVYLDGSTSTGVGQIGNLGVAVKAVLYRGDTFLLSGGLAIDCPTAPDMLCFGTSGGSSSGGGGAIQLLNQSVHLLPFVGAVWTPNDRFFTMGFMQFDLDANGDPVNDVDVAFPGAPVTTLQNDGRYYEQSMIYLEGMAGYWVRRNDTNHLINGIALFTELHGNQSLNNSAALQTQVGVMSGGNISILDLTFGADFQIGELTTLTAAYCTPLSDQREFDNQFRFLFNRRF